MALVYLIRHGQASFGSDDYDRLSELGQRQAGVLGEHIRAAGLAFDAVICGELKRQRDTAEGIRTALGPRAPELQVDSDFNECDYAGVIRAYLPRFMAEVGDPRGLAEAEIFRDRKLFELAFRFMIKCWMDHVPHDQEGLEDWRSFCNRVGVAINGLIARHGPRGRLLVVTSGGTIGAALRSVLGLSNKRTLSLIWTIYNASVTQLYYGRTRRHEDALLLGFNNISHLEHAGGRALVTFR
jgi:broad specificity phosphatase PhoE